MCVVGCASGVGTLDASDAATCVVNNDPNPSCIYNVFRHQCDGWIITNPQVTLVFWGDYWLTTPEATNYQTTWTTLFQEGQVFQRLSQYGIGNPVIGPSYQSSVTFAEFPHVDGGTTFDAGSTWTGWTIIDDDTLEPELANEVAAGTLPVPTHESIYVVYLPPSTTTAYMIKSRSSGYHIHAMYGNTMYSYAIITYNVSTSWTDVVVSHELYEASSNPDFGGYWCGLGGQKVGDEIADLCEGSLDNFGDYTVQKVWSADTCQCQ